MASKNCPNITLKEFYKVPFTFLSMSGLKVIYWDANDRMSLGEKLGFGWMIFNIATAFPLKVNFLINGTLETSLDYTALTIYWLFALNSVSKLTSIVFGAKHLDAALKKMLLRFPRTANEATEYEIEFHAKRIERDNKFLAIFHMLTTTMFNAFPLIQSSLEYTQNGKFTYRLPYMMKYPMDIKKPLLYGIAYFVQVLAAYNSSLVFLGTDLVLITSIRLINMNFKYLKKRILKFQPTGTDKDIGVIGKTMEFHEEILLYSIHVDAMFNVSIFMNYFASGMVICLLGYQVVAGTELLSFVKFFTFIFSSIAHLYLIASSGQEMTDLSLDVSDAFFHHRWYLANLNYQRMLPLPLARAQRPAHLHAFKFFIISMESFKTLLSTSYQFFALINTQLEN